jgi:hypothetical protein
VPKVRGDPTVLNRRARGGVAALHLCAGNLGRAKHLALLLGAGADPNVCTDSGHSALDAALELRRRLAAFPGELERASRSGPAEVARVAWSGFATMWEPIAIAGDKHALFSGEGESEIRTEITIGRRTVGAAEENEAEAEEVDDIDDDGAEVINIQERLRSWIKP